VEGEEMAMATRTTNLKEIATIAAKRGILKQRAGCFPVMQVKDQHGLSPEKMETKQALLQKKPETKSNIF
jgi:hypothetical protein